MPGLTAGRSFGIIDEVELLPVTESIGLLEPSAALGKEEVAGLHAWFGDLANWMTTSANGKQERATTNNHAI